MESSSYGTPETAEASLFQVGRRRAPISFGIGFQRNGIGGICS